MSPELIGILAVGAAILDATRHDGTIEHDTRDVSISFEKIDGDWRITAMTVSAARRGE